MSESIMSFTRALKSTWEKELQAMIVIFEQQFANQDLIFLYKELSIAISFAVTINS